MHFLCKGHYTSLAGQSCMQLSAQWFEWMNQASVHYEMGSYQKGLSYAGSAIDISLILMGKADEGFKGAASKNLVLATIYLINMLRQQKEFDKACCYQECYSDVLKKYSALQTQSSVTCEVDHCMSNLMDNTKHVSFFEDHVNLSISVNADMVEAIYH